MPARPGTGDEADVPGNAVGAVLGRKIHAVDEKIEGKAIIEALGDGGNVTESDLLRDLPLELLPGPGEPRSQREKKI